MDAPEIAVEPRKGAPARTFEPRNDNDMISPGTEEDCLDGFDNDCDGRADDADPECFSGDDDTGGDDDDDTVSADDDTGDEPGTCTCRVNGSDAGGAAALLSIGSGLAARRRSR